MDDVQPQGADISGRKKARQTDANHDRIANQNIRGPLSDTGFAPYNRHQPHRAIEGRHRKSGARHSIRTDL